MSTSLRLLGAIAIVCAAVLGLGFVFGYITEEFLMQNSMKLGLGLVVLFAAVLGFRMLTAGRGNAGDTEPPPTL